MRNLPMFSFSILVMRQNAPNPEKNSNRPDLFGQISRMDNESYNICLSLAEWLESICRTIPNFEIARTSFYIDGRVIQAASPGVLRVGF